MASNTENLGLLKKNPSTDGADTFNIQTMLNDNWDKLDANAGTVAQTLANILKPTTPPIIGLPPSTTPDGMFQALGNTGELHVWRKTVVNASEKPAGYTLGAETKKTLGLTRNSDSSSWAITVELASSVSVDDAGNVTLVSPSNLSVYAYNEFANSFSGKFFRLISVGSSVTGTQIDTGDIYFVPSGNTLKIRADSLSSKFYLDLSMKLVTGYAKTPAGTTTTYPVSTNPNAYQEGSDAKPAGYTLGEVETGKFVLGTGEGSSKQNLFYISSSVTVDDSGNISLENRGSTYVNGESGPSMQGNAANVVGKFIVLDSKASDSDFDVGTVWYIPPDATTRNNYLTDGEAYNQYNIINYVTKRQPVTGYAAIPAGTTIEYLGKLGDKARVQVVSYVGTGTYGQSNPNSLTFDFVPKAVFLFSADTYNKCFVAYGDTTGFVFDSDATTVLHVSWNGKNISWFNTDNDLRQHNVSGYKYRAIAIG